MSFTEKEIEAAARALLRLTIGEDGDFWDDDEKRHWCDKSRAVIAAIHPTVTTEWATKSGNGVLTWSSWEQAEAQSASTTASSDGGKTWRNTFPPVMSRQVTEWVPIESGAPEDMQTTRNYVVSLEAEVKRLGVALRSWKAVAMGYQANGELLQARLDKVREVADNSSRDEAWMALDAIVKVVNRGDQ